MASSTSEPTDLQDDRASEKPGRVCIADDETIKENADSTDEYSYTKRDEFTSEIFKIEIGNLPKVYSVNVGPSEFCITWFILIMI